MQLQRWATKFNLKNVYSYVRLSLAHPLRVIASLILKKAHPLSKQMCTFVTSSLSAVLLCWFRDLWGAGFFLAALSHSSQNEASSSSLSAVNEGTLPLWEEVGVVCCCCAGGWDQGGGCCDCFALATLLQVDPCNYVFIILYTWKLSSFLTFILLPVGVVTPPPPPTVAVVVWGVPLMVKSLSCSCWISRNDLGFCWPLQKVERNTEVIENFIKGNHWILSKYYH